MPGFFLLALCGCPEPQSGPGAPSVADSLPAKLTVAGELRNNSLDEVSGVARSARDPAMLWVHNDSGDKARLYAIDVEGRHRGRLKLDDSDNRDWEDMASFVLDDTPYLLIADIGDNDATHASSVLYVVEEPDLADDDEQHYEPAWRVRFTYPGGPRDAEAVAVDAAGGRVLILSKRELPPALYSVPLEPDEPGPVEAERLGPVTSLPAPTRQELEFAPHAKEWHWQPTAMDISPDGSAIIVLTYAAIYYYSYTGDWLATLNQPPLGFGLRGIRDAEAAAFGAGSQQIFLTIERKNAPLFRIDRDLP